MTKRKITENCRNCGNQFQFSKNVFYCSLLCRFEAKINKSGDCWEWTGSRGSHGYGQISIEGNVKTAHRLSYEMSYGPIGKGLCVCHHCDNRGCVNPAHLFLGSHSENLRDAAKKNRTTRKFSKKMIRRVKEKIKKGVPLRQIAREENTSDMWVRDVKLNKIHRHIL